MTEFVRGGAILLLVGSILMGCSPSSGSAAPPPSAPPGGAVVTAQGNRFDRTQLTVPAGRPFQLLFENREGAPHNIRIYDGNVDPALFVGEIFGGPGSRMYDVPAIPAGTHQFRCDVHPDMTGTVSAG
jgi:plastocyanin